MNFLSYTSPFPCPPPVYSKCFHVPCFIIENVLHTTCVRSAYQNYFQWIRFYWMAKSVSFYFVHAYGNLQLGTIFICSGHNRWCCDVMRIRTSKSLKHSFVICKCFLFSFLFSTPSHFTFPLDAVFLLLLLFSFLMFLFIWHVLQENIIRVHSFVHYIIVYLWLSPAVNVSISLCSFSFVMLILCRRTTI